MAKVRYTMRFYRVHDLDIVTFIETHEFNISHAMYSALSAFSNGEAFVIKIPPRRRADLPQLRRVYSRALILDTEKDAKAISILSLIKPGYRNSFLKNLLRQYLCFPLSEEFLDDQESVSYFDDLFSVFRKDRKVAEAGSLIKETKEKKKSAERKTEHPANEKKQAADEDFGNRVTENAVFKEPTDYDAEQDITNDDEVNSIFAHILDSE